MPTPEAWKDVVSPEASPRTEARNAELRRESLAAAEASGRDISQFTCDTCRIEGAKAYCPFIYDHYNTDGDCLVLK